MLNDNKTDRPIKTGRRGLPFLLYRPSWYYNHTITRNISGVIRKMSNDTAPALDNIDGEEHYNVECCVKQEYTKTINGVIYYIHIRICYCRRRLLSTRFWHGLPSCFYKSRQQFGKPFIIKEFCTCNRPRIAYAR